MASPSGDHPFGALASSVSGGHGGTYAGVDQGFDITGGPLWIRALGHGRVTRVLNSGSGWPGEGALLVYKLTDGPLAGRSIYTAEDFKPNPALKIGDLLSPGEVLGTATGSGKAPGIEVGFADAQGHAFGSPTGGPQPQGEDFLTFVEALSRGHTVSVQNGRVFENLSGSSGGGVVSSVGGAISGLPPFQAGQAVGSAAKSAVTAVGGGISSVEDAIKFAFSYRFLEIIGGGLLVMVAVVGLMKEVGINVPNPVSGFGDSTPPELARKAARAPRPERPIDAGSDSDRRVPQTTAYGRKQATGDDIPF